MTSFATYESLIPDLQNLDVHVGDGVFVHASMKAVGPTIGGPRTVIEALLNCVGKMGLVAMPGFSTDAYLPDNAIRQSSEDAEVSMLRAAVPGFDLSKSSAREMGVIAETFRTWPGTVRSNHPTTSVCLNGSQASEISEDHSLAWAMGKDTPFGKLYERENTKILLIGVGWNRCTALHTAENSANHQRHKVRRFKSGGVWMETPDVADDLGRLFPAVGKAFERKGRVVVGKLGAGECKLCDFKELVDFASDWIGNANKKSGDRT